MGNDSSNINSFNKQQWDLVERTEVNCLWRSRRDPTLHVQQYDIYSKDSQQYQHEKESFQIRSQYPQLVAGVFFKEQQRQQFCSTNHHSSLFIEKIPIRLADVQHIPFPDCLHLYFQTLFGFQIIATKYGHFEVQQQHIGVNEKGVVKVWLNRDFSKSYINGGKITQEQMVKGTIDILDKNCDPNIPGNIPTIRNYLYRNADTLNFEQATTELRSYCISFNQGFVPEKLECIDKVGGIYAIANRLSHEGESFGTGRYSQDTRRIQTQYERPRISSEHQLQSEQRITYPKGPVGQFHLKASEALPNSSRQAVIVSPNAYRQNMQVIRRKRQEQPIQFVQNTQINPMRYSQTGPHSQIVTLQSPRKVQQLPQQIQGKNSEIRFTAPQQKMVAVPGQAQLNPIHPSQPSYELSRQPIAIEPNYQQFTFKSFNQNQIEAQQQIANTSLANFSLGPSQNSTQRDRNSLFSQQAPSSTNYSPSLTLQSNNHNPAVQQLNGVTQPLRPLQQYPSGTISARNQVVPIQQPPQQSFRTQANKQRSNIQEESFTLKQQVPQTIIKQSSSIKQTNLNQAVSFQEFTSKPIVYSSQKTAKEYDISGQIASKNSSQPTVGQSLKGKNYTISADDGKSSAEFLQKLREMTQGLSSDSELKAQTNQTPTYSHNQYYESNFSSGFNNFQPRYSYQANVQGRNFSSEDEEFGRNAVSNIIQTQQGFSKQYSGFSSEPLKFENNLTMKYSRLEADQPSPQRKSNVGAYETDLDPDLLADLRKIKQS